MRLQRLEIAGFKSFSDRAELAFDTDVTAIVGPNGCGKSNVADAITWVLGEQSARSLRGDKMEDVIFSGSDARKPGASAEVRLRLANVTSVVPLNGNGHGPVNGHHAGSNGHGAVHVLDGVNGNGHGHLDEAPVNGEASLDDDTPLISREVEVTRRLYRSGESEYLIDGQQCRLRDVHELLMDTGLGAKAYAIIEQGKIGMILSSRPTDRRQLIEEAAGVTKYKARRRAAELKLEAAQQNLTRVDDIVFEVEKQRGTLKRQAAKARRYRRLRDELRRWEKILFARKSRELSEAIAAARETLASARADDVAAAARVSEGETALGRLRIELAEGEAALTAARDKAHARELDITRRQQQMQFCREQAAALEARIAERVEELVQLEARREPAGLAIEGRRLAASQAASEREAAASGLAAEVEGYELAHRDLEGLEGDVEAARSEVFSALNAATALRHAIEHAVTARDRAAEELAKLEGELSDLGIEAGHAERERATAAEQLRRAQESLEETRLTRAAREADLASARIEHTWREQSLRSGERDLAGLSARLRSLEELEAARAGFSDAARLVLAEANGHVGQQGAVADYLEVDRRYERAVESCLGELLEHVIVVQRDQAAAGLRLVRERGAGHCGFIIAEGASTGGADPVVPGEGLTPLAEAVRIEGPYADAIRGAIGQAWIADSFEAAAAASSRAHGPVATIEGDVFRGPHVLAGGDRSEARGILATKGEIKELRERIAAEREALARLADETAQFEAAIAQATAAVAGCNAEYHRQEKAIVGFEAQVTRANEELTRIARKRDVVTLERRRAADERESLDARQAEAQSSVARIDEEQRLADERLSQAQRRLFEAREHAEQLSQRMAEARATHAALVERAAGVAAEVERLEEAARDLDTRIETAGRDIAATRGKVAELQASAVEQQQLVDEDVRVLDGLQQEVRRADEGLADLRAQVDGREARLKDARAALDAARALVAELDVARATAESDLAHLAGACWDAVQATLDEVVAEVARMEQEAPGQQAAAPADAGASPVAMGDGEEDEAEGDSEPVVPASTAEEAIAVLRGKIDRLGPVNMMAIEQFDELETRHTFLTAQRKDLVESIAATSEAIKRIDETTHQRFNEAFAAINLNFQRTFSTLFGGGRAGLALIDEANPLESGIEIIAQPPGKRLQSVQLLSGGEKALTAISLMFGIFQYKPSPFCLLDEIDAPLDDANIGRFVEMLRGMQAQTQFILITHNRKTMEIADRLYGVTMEEPGVSRLISVRLN
ncbi:MAG TPA: chromosome segregation protein SMC [Vicinamibacterales bacterium]